MANSNRVESAIFAFALKLAGTQVVLVELARFVANKSSFINWKQRIIADAVEVEALRIAYLLANAPVVVTLRNRDKQRWCCLVPYRAVGFVMVYYC